MAEVLEIQVKDASPQQLAGPPQPPAAPAGATQPGGVPAPGGVPVPPPLIGSLSKLLGGAGGAAPGGAAGAAGGLGGAGAGGAAGAASGLAGAVGPGVAAALGPVGAVAGAVAAVVGKVVESLGQVVDVVGKSAVRVAGLDTGGLGDAFQGLAKQVPLFGSVLDSAIGSARGFANALDSTAQKLAPFSATLSQAQAQAEFTRFQGDMRRGQQLGPELAEFVKARTKLEETGKDALAVLLKPLIPIATKIVEYLTEFIEWFMNDFVNGIIEIQNRIANIENGIRELWGMEPIALWKKIEFNTRKEQDIMEDPFLKEFLQIERPAGEDVAAGGIDDALRIPAFGGL